MLLKTFLYGRIDQMGEKIVILAVLALLIIAAFILGFIFRKKRTKSAPEARKARLFQFCPLCGTELKRGERVHAVSFPAQGHKLIHIFGCPFCYGKSPGKKARKCPSCKRVLPEDAYLAGRMWTDKGIIKVHVSGCTLCLPLSAGKAREAGPGQKSV
jgi:hypothetical protein